jgi:hypothetical protein
MLLNSRDRYIFQTFSFQIVFRAGPLCHKVGLRNDQEVRLAVETGLIDESTENAGHKEYGRDLK